MMIVIGIFLVLYAFCRTEQKIVLLAKRAAGERQLGSAGFGR
jgi:hypothetical protein